MRRFRLNRIGGRIIGGGSWHFSRRRGNCKTFRLRSITFARCASFITSLLHNRKRTQLMQEQMVIKTILWSVPNEKKEILLGHASNDDEEQDASDRLSSRPIHLLPVTQRVDYKSIPL